MKTQFLKMIYNSMILTDRIIRYLSKDIMLPTRCYATKKQLVSVKECCDCKIFCKKPPKGSVPAYAFKTSKANPHVSGHM